MRPNTARLIIGQGATWRGRAAGPGSCTVSSQTQRDYHQPGVLRVLQTKGETRAFYNKIAGVYDLLAERSEERPRQAGRRLFAAQPGEKVLEIGFGTGHCLAALARAVGPGGKVYGIDLSDEMVKRSQQRLRKAKLDDRVDLRRGDALALPWQAETLDGVFMSFVLELFDTPEIPVVLGECKRVLRPGGRIVVVGTSRLSPNGLVTEVFEWTHRHFPNLLDCRPILVRQAVADAGFRIEKSMVEKVWVLVEIVLGVKGQPPADGGGRT